MNTKEIFKPFERTAKFNDGSIVERVITISGKDVEKLEESIKAYAKQENKHLQSEVERLKDFAISIAEEVACGELCLTIDMQKKLNKLLNTKKL